jgi:hypothetical protein
VKTCQFCAESIQDAAIVCKHCGRNLSGQPLSVRVDQNWMVLFLWGVIIVLGLMAVSYLGQVTGR